MTAENLLGKPRRYQPASETASSHPLETSSCTIVRSTMQNVVKQARYVKGVRTYADPDKYDNTTNGTDERRFGY
jgi:hypothetical protein